jgi:uncharacterized damage-inducible protein DinB
MPDGSVGTVQAEMFARRAMSSERQQEVLRQIRDDMRRTHARIIEIARRLGPEELVRRPAPDKWSVGDVLEHLLLMDALFLGYVEPLVRASTRDASAFARPWRPTFLGNKIAESLVNPKPAKAIKKTTARTPRAAVVERFAEDAARFEGILEDSALIDWNAVRLRPPVMPWLPIKINLGDVFRIHTVHVQRHLGQIERVAATL